ncbi:unnamed protein product [Victoria cruziana]
MKSGFTNSCLQILLWVSYGVSSLMVAFSVDANRLTCRPPSAPAVSQCCSASAISQCRSYYVSRGLGISKKLLAALQIVLGYLKTS